MDSVRKMLYNEVIDNSLVELIEVTNGADSYKYY